MPTHSRNVEIYFGALEMTADTAGFTTVKITSRAVLLPFRQFFSYQPGLTKEITDCKLN